MIKNFLQKLLLVLNLFYGVGVVALPTVAMGQTVDIDFGDEDDLEGLEMAQKVKALILGALAYLICPILGIVTGIKGWQMVSNAERGDKAAGAFVLVAGVIMIVLPTVILQVYKQLTS